MKLKRRLRKYKSYVKNLLMPALVLGFITGTLTSITVTLYKLVAKHVVELSIRSYEYVREHLYYIPIALLVFALISIISSYVYKRIPEIKGGGIPIAIGVLRGLVPFKWLRTLIGVFTMSLTSFLLGVPLGTEGPSVQTGTAIGRGAVRIFGKKNMAWDRYSMSGGACAGFSVATGSPVSGIMFAIEEAHQRISPTIIIVASFSVLFANITSRIISPLLGVEEKLFEIPALEALTVYEYWIPVVIGLGIGLFGVLFLASHRLIEKIVHKKLSHLPLWVMVFIMLVLTLVAGLFSGELVSTGHELIVELFDNHIEILILSLALIIRTFLTLGANVVGITGGTFIPVLAIGAVASSLLGNLLIACGLDPQLYIVVLVLGITGCISGAMKMPLTSIVFAIEALSCYNNIIPVIMVSMISFLVTELFGTDSINEVLLELRLKEMNKCKEQITIDTKIIVKANSFAVGKQIRDIFWPSNLFVLSLRHKHQEAEVDEHGGKELMAGDVLHIRYSTVNDDETKAELFAIVGEQKIKETVTEEI